jgi:hypothetical protein
MFREVSGNRGWYPGTTLENPLCRCKPVLASARCAFGDSSSPKSASIADTPSPEIVSASRLVHQSVASEQ